MTMSNRVIITVAVFETRMLKTRFQGNRPSSSVPLCLEAAYNLIEIGPVVSEEKPFEMLTEDRQVTFGEGH